MKLGVEAALVNGVLVPGDVEIVDGTVAAYGLAGTNGSGVAVPGFLDLQVNGFAGVDLMNADDGGYRRAGEALLENGVTAYLPTFISAPEDELLTALRNLPSDRAAPASWACTSRGRSCRRSGSGSTRLVHAAIRTPCCSSGSSTRDTCG